MQVPKLKSTWDMIMERGLAKNIMLMPGRKEERLGSCQVERRKVLLMPGRKGERFGSCQVEKKKV
jgi:hypothetical protein